MPLFFRYFFISLFISSAALGQKDSIKSEMTFDFGWTRNRNVNLWPIIKKSTTKDQTDVQALFTLFRYNRNIKAGTKHVHLLPLFLNDSSSVKHDLRLFSIYYPSLFRIQKDSLENSRSFIVFDIAPKINFLELTKSKDGLFVQNNLFFFLWYKNNQTTKRSHLVAFPLYWQYQNPTYKSITFVPVFSKGKSEDGLREHLFLTPFFWHLKNHEKSRNILFPLVWNSKGEKNESKNVLFPIYWSYKDSAETRKTIFPVLFIKKNNERQSLTFFPVFWSYKNQDQNNKIVFPLLWSLKNKRYKSFTFFPLISKGHSEDSSKSHIAITPLFWHTKKVDGYKNILFPIWWNKKSGWGSLERKYNVILPFYWSYSNQSENVKFLFPILWKIKRSDQTIFTFIPFFSIRKSTDNSESKLRITPFFSHRKTQDGYRNILFPFWWNGSSGKGVVKNYYNVVFPIYWSFKNVNDNNKVVFPVYWNLKRWNYHTFAIMPFFSKGRSTDSTKSHIGITPFFWHWEKPDHKRNLFFPIWWHKNSGKGDHKEYYNVIFPIYWCYKDKFRNNKIIFPFIWSLKRINYQDKAPYHTFAFMPFFSIGRTTDSANTHRLSHIGITPLFWHYKYPQGYRNVLFPLWWSKRTGSGSDEKYTNVVFPLYWEKKYKDKEYKVLFPFLWLTQNGSKQSKVLFPLLWNKKDENKDNLILFPLVWSFKNKTQQSLTVFPFFSKGQSADQRYKHLITPLFCHFKNKQNSVNFYFPFFWSIKSDTGENSSHRSGAFPLIWSKKDTSSRNAIVFPFIYSLNNKSYRSFTLFPIFSKGQSADDSKKHWITPVFWHIKNKENYTNVFFPLWWSLKRDSGENLNRKNILFPLLWTNKDKNTNNIILLPVFYSLKNKTYKSLTFAPLFSIGHSDDRQFKHYAVTPFFWHFKKPHGHKEVFFPLYSYSADTSHAIKFDLLYFLLRYKGNRQYRSMNFIWPLCEYTKAPDMVAFRFAPVIWYKKSSSLNYFSIQPFYYHSKSMEAERFNILWEFFSHKNYFNQKRSTSFLWKFVYRDKYQNGDVEFRILYLLYANVHKGGNIEKSFFPIYHYTKTKEGGNSFSMFLKFYSSLSRPIADSKEFYKETKVFWFLRIRSNFDYLKQKGIKNIKP